MIRRSTRFAASALVVLLTLLPGAVGGQNAAPAAPPRYMGPVDQEYTAKIRSSACQPSNGVFKSYGMKRHRGGGLLEERWTEMKP